MNCARPFVKGWQAFGCGQCLPCRINRKRIWSHRITLEARSHGENTFATLTYDDTHLPADLSLVPRHAITFLKRLRKAYSPARLRYYLVGEYGDQTQRPHYHAALFGFPNCTYGLSRYSKSRTICCPTCEIVKTAWGYGHIQLGEVNEFSASYISGYVTKKMTEKTDERLHGRHPEFARMSNRPGIGAALIDDVASQLLTYYTFGDGPGEFDDVPGQLQHGKKSWPLGKYLKRRLRTRVGLPEKVSQRVLSKMEEKLLPVRTATETIAPAGFKKEVFRSLLISASEQTRLNLKTRHRIFKQKREL